MESKIKQKKWFAAIGVALALLMAAVGIPVGISASAAETAEIQPMGTYIPDTPRCEPNAHYAAISFNYIGEAGPSPSDTYISFGNNSNLSSPTKTVYGNSYSEVGIPSVGSNGLTYRYFWARVTSKVNGTFYDSSVTYFSQTSAADIIGSPVLASIVSGSINANQWYTVNVNLAGKSVVYCSLVYSGKVYDFVCNVSNSGFTNVDGVKIEYQSTSTYVKFKSPFTFVASQYSAQDTQTGGFAVRAV